MLFLFPFRKLFKNNTINYPQMALIHQALISTNQPTVLISNSPLLTYHNQSSISLHQYHLVTPYIFSNNLLHFMAFLVPHKGLQVHVLADQ